MKYLVEVQGERVEVVLDQDGVRLGDATVSAAIAAVEGTPVQMLTLGDAVHRVVVQRGPSGGRYVLWVDGWRLEVEALDERTRAIRDLTVKAAPSGPAPLIAPMPGLIVKVLVQPGAMVHAGEPLVVIEAMKMENELRATTPGVVTAVHAKAGGAVEKGAVLVELAAP